ncbi:MAG: cob(I)yrinic acid a,c-diamide adenosyltransferase [Syntrophomonadaceae bacterium]|nr:cob(I)yrinic acid a,c-diamide adenosyltransferase [Syntrophomonadaceae bacterium]
MKLIQIYTGDGKGKTTAALGLAMRSAGHGFKVRIIQFLKGSTYSGELVSAARLGIEVFQFGRTCPHAAAIKTGFMICPECGECWIGLKEINELDIRKTQMAWDLARETIAEGRHNLLILDEIINAVNLNLVSRKELIEWLLKLPTSVEVVLTGRNAAAELIEIADLVTEMRKLKHPYVQDCKARRGIEY